MNNCGYPRVMSLDSADHFEIIVTNRPLSPRRPNFVKNFQNHALSLITTTAPKPDINSHISSEKKIQISITNHFSDSASQTGIAPLPTVQI